VPVYVLVGAAVWLGFHESGIHATIAGVILGLMTPATSWVSGWRLRAIAERAGSYLQGERYDVDSPESRAALLEVETAARETISPLQRLETAIHPWQSFLIIPLFALVNAGVQFEVSDIASPISVAVILGLAVGKPLGIFLASWVAVKMGIAELPQGVTWPVVLAGGCLAGIGFTMALFISELAMPPLVLPVAKVGVLAGSALSALVGMTLLNLLLPRAEQAP
jgi:NhaA family Na+:H+ antiporter